MNSKKLITYIYYSIVVVLIVIFAYRTYSIPSDAKELQQGPASFGLWQSYIYIGIAVFAALVLSIIGIVQKPKALIWTLGGIAVLAVLFFHWKINGE